VIVGAWHLSGSLDDGDNNDKGDRDTVDEYKLGGGGFLRLGREN
jgi:hypothetical protein